MAITPRNAAAGEILQLAQIWFDAWHESHAQIVPAELVRLRTFESFRDRLRAALTHIRVVGPLGSPAGFSLVKGDELYQLFVAAHARGSGVAAALVADAEARISASGFQTAWLACAIGNGRAARFYEKCGWHRAGTMIIQADTRDGVFPLEVWRYRKALRRS
jgi:GNAT superfamily N-acetyltransferase